MQHPAQAPGGEEAQNGHRVAMGLPVVEDHGPIMLQRNGDLLAQDLLLDSSGRIGVPVVVQADLPHRHHLGVLEHLQKLLADLQVPLSGVPGMDAHGPVEKVVLSAQLEGGQTPLPVRSAVQDADDAFSGQRRQQLLPVGIELPVIVVGVRIEDFQQGGAPFSSVPPA